MTCAYCSRKASGVVMLKGLKGRLYHCLEHLPDALAVLEGDTQLEAS